MAKKVVRNPYFVREVTSQICQMLDIHPGVPMEVSYPNRDDFDGGRVDVHFEGGWHFVLRVNRGHGHYGEYVGVTAIRGSLSFNYWDGESAASMWINNLIKYAGPIQHSFENGRLKFTVEGDMLACLAMNASNRRNNLPEYEWNDPNNPINTRT